MPTPTYNLIQEITVSGSVTTSINFTSVPQTFDDLVIVGKGKQALNEGISMRYNSDSGTNYYRLASAANGGTSATTNTSGDTSIAVTSGDESQNHIFTININGYKDVNWRKSSIGQNFTELGSTSNTIIYWGSLWASLSAITTITLSTNAGTNYVAGTVFQLYGIKGSN
jgi:hypothetical protein